MSYMTIGLLAHMLSNNCYDVKDFIVMLLGNFVLSSLQIQGGLFARNWRPQATFLSSSIRLVYFKF